MSQQTEQAILPARQLNEFVYCPRLYYFEYVEGVFLHNADTLAGHAQHNRVEQREDGLPTPAVSEMEGAEEIIHSRSVSLFSEKWGVSAKLDLVEAERDTNGNLRVTPVEYKKGAPRESNDGKDLWDADRIQLGLQILLLRENGFLCDEGIVFYRTTRQRVSFKLDLETERWIENCIRQARIVANLKHPPPPLEDSPKCPRCSLAPICLPDETRMLRDFSDLPGTADPQLYLEINHSEDPTSKKLPPRVLGDPFESIPEIRLPSLKPNQDIRRLIAPNEESKALYLNTPGQFVGKKGECLVVKENKEVIAEIRLNDLHHVALFGPIQLSTGLIQTLCERDIPITYFSMGGWFYGMTRGHGLKNVFTRIEQFRQAGDPESALYHARLFIHGKIRNQRTLLMRNHIEPPKGTLKALKYFASHALGASSLHYLLGVEGSAANVYFDAFGGMLKFANPTSEGLPSASKETSPFHFDFHSRNRRPPRDPVNALLSLVYSLLTKDCTLACYAVGFDPYVGYLHQPRFGRPALALDLMEEFRPLIADSVVITMINNGMLSESDFVYAGQSCSLNAGGRKKVFLAYEKRLADAITHPVFGYKVSYRRAIELQARLLAKVLTGEIESYFPFTTR